jgi:hypothetical protein
MMRRPLVPLLLAGCAAWAQSLAGVIDIHAHADPDGANRSIDALDLARLARERGMRGLVLKNHYESTAAQAYLVRKMVPGIEVFGGISLDLTVGGVNPAAVEWMTKMDGGYGRVVWLPTFDSEHQVRSSGESRPFAPVARDGALLPATLEVIQLAARHNLLLETGHSSPAEALLIIAEARRQGVRNVVVTHAMQRLVGMSIAEMKRAAELGAYLEFVWVQPGTPAAAESARAIREVGPEHCILSSDLGQAGNPLHPDGLAAFFEDLKNNGLTQAEIDLMSKTNPARALGLEP